MRKPDKLATAVPKSKPRKPRQTQPRPPRQPGHPWTVKELAEAARTSESQIYELVKAGEVRAQRFGRIIRIADTVAREMLGWAEQTAA